MDFQTCKNCTNSVFASYTIIPFMFAHTHLEIYKENRGGSAPLRSTLYGVVPQLGDIKEAGSGFKFFRISTMKSKYSRS